jgi:hypothetical protein
MFRLLNMWVPRQRQGGVMSRFMLAEQQPERYVARVYIPSSSLIGTDIERSQYRERRM